MALQSIIGAVLRYRNDTGEYNYFYPKTYVQCIIEEDGSEKRLVSKEMYEFINSLYKGGSTENTAYGELVALVNNNVTRIDEHNVLITNHTTQLNTHTTTLSEHTTKLNTHDNTLATHTTQIGTLQSSMATATTDISGLKSLVYGADADTTINKLEEIIAFLQDANNTVIAEDTTLEDFIHAVHKVTLNGALVTDPTFYAPTTVGSANQVLVSSGNGAPTWKALVSSQIPVLDATKITTGTFADARIPYLNANKINAGVFTDARIPYLNASKINDGVFAVARIPDLSATKITSDKLDGARIPTLTNSHLPVLLPSKMPSGYRSVYVGTSEPTASSYGRNDLPAGLIWIDTSANTTEIAPDTFTWNLFIPETTMELDMLTLDNIERADNGSPIDKVNQNVAQPYEIYRKILEFDNGQVLWYWIKKISDYGDEETSPGTTREVALYLGTKDTPTNSSGVVGTTWFTDTNVFIIFRGSKWVESTKVATDTTVSVFCPTDLNAAAFTLTLPAGKLIVNNSHLLNKELFILRTEWTS